MSATYPRDSRLSVEQEAGELIVRVAVPLVTLGTTGVPSILPPPDVSHAPDFASVVWRGYRFTFSRKQRRAVALLFQARDEGYDYVSQEMLLDAAESDQLRLRELFRDNAAWGVMIVSGLETGGCSGTFRISP